MEQIKYLVEEKHRGKWTPLLASGGKRDGQQRRVFITEEQADIMNINAEENKIRYVKAEGKSKVKNEAKNESKDVAGEKKRLQKAYEEKFGKKPFHGWGVDKLIEKLEE